MHRKYPKIYRLGSEEVDGILDNYIIIQEKVDGSNSSCWLEGDRIGCGSRTRDITHDETGLGGFTKYANEHDGIRKLLEDNPDYRLFGEWLKPHTIKYNSEAYGHFYLFDIDDDGEFLEQYKVIELAEKYGIKHPEIFATGRFTHEEVMEFVGKTTLGEKGEGVVIKTDLRSNPPFENKWGHKRYAKVVSDEFKESAHLKFGGNSKHWDLYEEMYIVDKYITLGRIKKIVQKFESSEGRRANINDTARIGNTVYHDMITEEIWGIQKRLSKRDCNFNFKKLSYLCTKKAITIFHDMLNGFESVAYK